MNLLNEATAFAYLRHNGQTRKYTGEPYISHPMAVRRLVESVGLGATAQAAAVLHDVLEDTPTCPEELETLFGHEVTALVVALTQVSRPQDGNRARRKEIDREFLARQCADAQTIKLADLIDNSVSIINHDAKFAKVFIDEMEMLVEVLKFGNPVLRYQARCIIRNFKESI